jgi:paraquat-inducible protein A
MQPLIACHECDLLQREADVEPGGSARCLRCGALLYRNTPHSLNNTLAFAAASAVFFLLANYYPILDIELSGNHNAISLYGATVSLWDQGMPFVSSAVFITAILIPACELSLMLYLLLPLKLGLVPPLLAPVLRFVLTIRPWGMLEVFMLGILVSLVKLTANFRVIPGIALWSYAVLTFLLAALSASFNPRDLWQRLDHAGQKAGD